MSQSPLGAACQPHCAVQLHLSSSDPSPPPATSHPLGSPARSPFPLAPPIHFHDDKTHSANTSQSSSKVNSPTAPKDRIAHRSSVLERIQQMETAKVGLIRPKEASPTMALAGQPAPAPDDLLSMQSPRAGLHTRRESAPASRATITSMATAMATRRLTAPASSTIILPAAPMMGYAQTAAAAAGFGLGARGSSAMEMAAAAPLGLGSRAVTASADSTTFLESSVPLCCARHASFSFLAVLPPPPAYTSCEKLYVAPEKLNRIPGLTANTPAPLQPSPLHPLASPIASSPCQPAGSPTNLERIPEFALDAPLSTRGGTVRVGTARGSPGHANFDSPVAPLGDIGVQAWIAEAAQAVQIEARTPSAGPQASPKESPRSSHSSQWSGSPSADPLSLDAPLVLPRRLSVQIGASGDAAITPPINTRTLHLGAAMPGSSPTSGQGSSTPIVVTSTHLGFTSPTFLASNGALSTPPMTALSLGASILSSPGCPTALPSPIPSHGQPASFHQQHATRLGTANSDGGARASPQQQQQQANSHSLQPQASPSNRSPMQAHSGAVGGWSPLQHQSHPSHHRFSTVNGDSGLQATSTTPNTTPTPATPIRGVAGLRAAFESSPTPTHAAATPSNRPLSSSAMSPKVGSLPTPTGGGLFGPGSLSAASPRSVPSPTLGPQPAAPAVPPFTPRERERSITLPMSSPIFGSPSTPRTGGAPSPRWTPIAPPPTPPTAAPTASASVPPPLPPFMPRAISNTGLSPASGTPVRAYSNSAPSTPLSPTRQLFKTPQVSIVVAPGVARTPPPFPQPISLVHLSPTIGVVQPSCTPPSPSPPPPTSPAPLATRLDTLNRMMTEAAEKQDFEQCIQLREQIKLMEAAIAKGLQY